MTTIKNSLSPSQRVVSPQGRKPAQQQFKQDADLNSIMRKFQKTGAIDHANIHQGSYGMASPYDLHQAMNLVSNANTLFADLPSTVRNKFRNDPLAFFEYVQNPDNATEAATLGISLSLEAAKAAIDSQQTTPPAKQDASHGEGTGRLDKDVQPPVTQES